MGSSTGWGKSKDTQGWSPVENPASIIFTFSAAAAHTFTWPCTLPRSNRYPRLLLRSILPFLCAGVGNHTYTLSQAKSSLSWRALLQGDAWRPHFTLQAHPAQGTEMPQHIWQKSSCSRKTFAFVILHSWFIHDNGLFLLQPSLHFEHTRRSKTA